MKCALDQGEIAHNVGIPRAGLNEVVICPFDESQILRVEFLINRGVLPVRSNDYD